MLLVWELALEVVVGRAVEVLDWRVFVCVLDVGELLGVAQAFLLDGAADVVLDKVLVR